MFDENTNDCIKCPVGFYQDLDAQFDCKPCPDGKSTIKRGSRSSDSCLGNKFNVVPCFVAQVLGYVFYSDVSVLSYSLPIID